MVLLPLLAAAQEPHRGHAIRLGINAAFFTAGEDVGLGNYAELGLALNPRLAIVPRIMSANARSRTDLDFHHSSMVGGSLALRMTPFPDGYSGFKVDIGPSYTRMDLSRGRYDSRYPGRLISSTRSQREGLFGILGSASLGFRERQRLGGGFRFEVMTSFRDGVLANEMLQTGMFVNIAF
jgi:hypothetical protein